MKTIFFQKNDFMKTTAKTVRFLFSLLSEKQHLHGLLYPEFISPKFLFVATQRK